MLLSALWLFAASSASGSLSDPCHMPLPSLGADPATPASRLLAARHAVDTCLLITGETRHLLAGALASPSGGLQLAVQPASAEWDVAVIDLERTRRAAVLLERAHAAFGAPAVIVEPERPSIPEDRRACSAIMSSMGRIGIRALDGEQARSTQRTSADRAVAGGLHGPVGRDLVDWPDGDYILRVGMSRQSANATAYGVEMHSSEVVISMRLIRRGSSEAIEIAPTHAIARSARTDAASAQAERLALADAGALAASMVSADWLGALDGTRHWVLEVSGGNEGCTQGISQQHTSLRVLEHRPAVRSLFEGPAESVRAAAGSAQGRRIEHMRPGYIRIVCMDALSMRPLTWLAVAAGVLVAITGGVSVRRWKQRRHIKREPS
jgi:hypothetical protein